MQVHCNCAGKTFPCHHALALLMMFQEDAQVFRQANNPDWLEPPRAKPPRHETTRGLDRWQKEGLVVLEKWLFDLIYLGLEQARSYPYAFWHEMANRLVDARLGLLADELKTWGQGSNQDGWSEALLAKMGRLQILLEAFKRFENLSSAVQADLLRALGLQANLLPEVHHGHWLVIGRGTVQSSNRKLERIWLKSVETGRFALLEKLLLKPENANTKLLTGTIVQGSLSYYEGSFPLYAELRETLQIHHQHLSLTAEASVKAQLKHYADAKAKNPWLSVFPCHFSKVSIEASQAASVDTWVLRDAEGFQLSLAKRPGGLWPMRAQAFEQGLNVFGEYRNKQFFPLAMETAYAWSDLSVLRGGGL
jgi:hypothetical protein